MNCINRPQKIFVWNAGLRKQIKAGVFKSKHHLKESIAGVKK